MTFFEDKSGVSIQSISLEEKVNFLKNKEHYAPPTSQVEAIKTHMSWVFLTDKFAYKLKIPFRYDHMRLLTSKARHYNCLKEIRLNKRLAEKFYLGIVPLSVDVDGNLALGGGKRPVDWLLKMKRLPEKQMLDYRIRNKSIAPENLEAAAELLTQFYITADPVNFEAEEYPAKLKAELERYHSDLCLGIYELPQNLVDTIFQEQIAFLEQQRSLFIKRVKLEKIIEGHGDLKPDHICLEPPAVIDCLEFSEDLRTLDVFDDLAFLSLECDRMDASWVGEYFIRHYCDRSEDTLHKPLINFYKSYKAYIRALLSIHHIREEEYRDDPKWRRKALSYLDLAACYIDQAM